MHSFTAKIFRRCALTAIVIASAAFAADTGGPAPAFTLTALSGGQTALSQYKGQVVLVNFWATWCGPCKVEIPWMIEFQQKYSPRGFTILGVSLDEGGQKVAMSYPILLGSDTIAEKFGGILGLPTSMLFTRDGKKVRTIVGLVNHDDISKAIESPVSYTHLRAHETRHD